LLTLFGCYISLIMLIIQLEFKDILFTSWKESSSCQTIEFNSVKYLKRNGLDEFLVTLAKHFQIAVWSRYSNPIHSEMVQYIENLGIYIAYQRTDVTEFYPNEETRYEKRLKRLNHLGFNPSQIIALEDKIRLHENYGNHFIIDSFIGKKDQELKTSLPKLIEFENCTDTRRIND